MASERACKQCRTLFHGSTCPACQSKESVDTFKGRIVVLDADKSEIASKLTLKKAGEFAIRLR
jgi:DNA-directed RNA polymerase subunit E"